MSNVVQLHGPNPHLERQRDLAEINAEAVAFRKLERLLLDFLERHTEGLASKEIGCFQRHAAEALAAGRNIVRIRKYGVVVYKAHKHHGLLHLIKNAV